MCFAMFGKMLIVKNTVFLKTLELACKSVDIEYIHIPDLGIVSDKRQELIHKQITTFYFKSMKNNFKRK